jgi:hypothetical protein
MQFGGIHASSCNPQLTTLSAMYLRRSGAVCLLASLALVAAAQTAQQTAVPDSVSQPTVELPKTERQKKIAEDSAKLLKLAAELKVEVNKSTKDTLSLNVVRKANEIIVLASDLKDELRSEQAAK